MKHVHDSSLPLQLKLLPLLSSVHAFMAMMSESWFYLLVDWMVADVAMCRDRVPFRTGLGNSLENCFRRPTVIRFSMMIDGGFSVFPFRLSVRWQCGRKIRRIKSISATGTVSYISSFWDCNFTEEASWIFRMYSCVVLVCLFFITDRCGGDIEMGQGLEPLTADLCLSSRSQPPQLPSRTDFFEQSKNVFKVAAESITTEAPQQQQQLSILPLRRIPGRRSHNTTRTTLGTTNQPRPEPCQLTTAGNFRPPAQDTRFTLLSMLPGNCQFWNLISKLLKDNFI